MMKKYIKSNVMSVATISEGCLLSGTGGPNNGQFGSAKVSNFDETELESDQKEHTEN
jgi:hypothetical protein